jgi:hypothetical protein
MVDYEDLPVLHVKNWLTEQFFNSGIVVESDYAGIVPIVPVQDTDKTSKLLGNKPYIVYTIAPSPVVTQDFFMKEELVFFHIFSNNFIEVTAIGNFLVDMLDRRDSTAREVNESMSVHAINFKSFELLRTNEVLPSEQPAGRFVQSFIFVYQFTRQMGIDNRFAF